MSPILEILFTLALSTVCVLLGYRAGFRRGVQIGATFDFDIDFLKDIQLPTSDEITAAANSRHWDDKLTKETLKPCRLDCMTQDFNPELYQKWMQDKVTKLNYPEWLMHRSGVNPAGLDWGHLWAGWKN